MFKIAVIGGSETVIGFRALGLDVFPIEKLDEARAVLRSLTKETEGYAIIYIEEGVAEPIMAEIDKFKDSPIPAVILIPGRNGSLGLGQSALQSAVERAVGTNIL